MGSENEQLRKIFVGGLNRRTTEDSLKDYFSLWGTIVDCCIMREGKNGPSRGFGFVTFDNAQAVDDCLKVKRHELDNWEIEPKRSVPKGEAQSRTRKIFVGGLASTATEEDVDEYFTGLCTKFGQGKVLDVDLKRDKENPSRLRGFAFVTFDSEEIVDSICSISFHQIKLKQCEVKKAESQATMRKKEEQEMISSGGSRRSNSESNDTPNYGGFPNWGGNSGFSGMNSGFGGSGRRGHFGGGGGGGGNGGFGGGGMTGAGGMGAFGGGNFAANPAAAAALMTAGGFNPAAFAGFGQERWVTLLLALGLTVWVSAGFLSLVALEDSALVGLALELAVVEWELGVLEERVDMALEVVTAELLLPDVVIVVLVAMTKLIIMVSFLMAWET
ncbi:heteroproteinous nuclear ribonucleoprotein [Desmophyllum pertusum]|uniref:Heteroproteinous nuclear ribonucleoprotein n=1 Tax=Desmophyllum pertusum TaxID=174260 RepID=A0A9X0DAS5_9CNID|nr:heteroproteinous nuclear ribonucleoprotein [Desmophyllum pertusum]